MAKKKAKAKAISTDHTANPAPLGLLGFGMTTVLLNLSNAGVFEMNAMILGMGIFFGGAAQILAGLMEWQKGNTFGTTAFTSYGFFWLSLIALLVFPKLGIYAAPDLTAMGWYLLIWGILTLFLFIGTFRLNRALQVVFGLTTILFFMLAISDFTGNADLKILAGYEGILCGIAAIYTALAQVLDEVYGFTLLPLGPVKKK